MTTKKTVSQELDEITASAPTQTADEKAQERADGLKREAQWLRETALSSALTLHKQNGGMIQPERIVEDAKKFMSFIQGE